MIGHIRSYGRVTGAVLLVGMGLAAWLANPAPENPPPSIELPTHGPAMSVVQDASAVCDARIPASETTEQRPENSAKSQRPRMTRAPNWEESSDQIPWDGTIHFETSLQLKLDLPSDTVTNTHGHASTAARTKGPSPGADKSLRQPDMEPPYSASPPSGDGLAAPGAKLVSVPNLPDEPTSGQSESEMRRKMDEMARVASGALNGIDRLGRKVMDGARLPSPSRFDSPSRQRPRGPRAKLAPNWIRGSPGARLEISF